MAQNLNQKLSEGPLEDIRQYLKQKGLLNTALFVNHDAVFPPGQAFWNHDSFELYVVSHGCSDTPQLASGAPMNGFMTAMAFVQKMSAMNGLPKDLPGKIKLCACHGTLNHGADAQGNDMIFAQQVARMLGEAGYHAIYVGGVDVAVKRPKAFTGGQRMRVDVANTDDYVRRSYYVSSLPGVPNRGYGTLATLADAQLRVPAQARLDARNHPHHPHLRPPDKWGDNRPTYQNPKKLIYYPFNYLTA